MSEDGKEAAQSVSRGRSKSKGREITSRSVSLTRNDPPKKKTPPKNKEKPERKRKTPPENSPKLSVLERRSRFKRVQEKYKNQRCMKENR